MPLILLISVIKYLHSNVEAAEIDIFLCLREPRDVASQTARLTGQPLRRIDSITENSAVLNKTLQMSARTP
jgi:hypothetical protein